MYRRENGKFEENFEIEKLKNTSLDKKSILIMLIFLPMLSKNATSRNKIFPKPLHCFDMTIFE